MCMAPRLYGQQEAVLSRRIYMQNVRVVDVVDTGDTPTHGKTPYVITPFFAATRAGASCGHDPARPPASWVG